MDPLIFAIQKANIFMEEQKEKRVLSIELDNDVKRVSITGINSDEKIVMRQVLDEDDLEQATGGTVCLKAVSTAMEPCFTYARL